MSSMEIPFNKPYIVSNELDYLKQAHATGHLSGDGLFTKKCHAWLEETVGCQKAFLTQSCTAALEMAAILIDTQATDEIIMPSFTFVSTANPFVLRGGVPVFVDIRSDTLNIDETKIEAAITLKTKAIVVVHYAGVSCEMDSIMALAEKYNLFVIEDAAQGIMSSYKGRPLGSIGHLSAYSFHETKNIISGEGGALLINDSRFIKRAEIIRDKGTNRGQFSRGMVDKYTWIDVGSSFLPNELTAAFLFAQMKNADNITQRRIAIWEYYHTAFAILEKKKVLRRPIIPSQCQFNGHIYYLLLNSIEQRSEFIIQAERCGIHPVFHYIPLHNSLAGKKYGRSHGNLSVTNQLANCIVRLPLWLGIEAFLEDVVCKLVSILKAIDLIGEK